MRPYYKNQFRFSNMYKHIQTNAFSTKFLIDQLSYKKLCENPYQFQVQQMLVKKYRWSQWKMEPSRFYFSKERQKMTKVVAHCIVKKKELPTSTSRSNDIVHLVHTDLYWPMEKKSFGMARKFLLFVDHYSRMAFGVFFFINKW